MNKFSLLVENKESKKYFKIKSEINLAIESSNEGEALYASDLTLSSIDSQFGFTAKKVEEISKEEYDELLVENCAVISSAFSCGNDEEEDDWDKLSDEDKALKYWDTLFGDKSPTSAQKLEFYHNMRSAGIKEEVLSNLLRDKLLGK